MEFIMDRKLFESTEPYLEFTIKDKLKEFAGPNCWGKTSKYLKDVSIGNFAEFGVGSASVKKSKIKDVKLLFTRNSITKYVEPTMFSFICGDGKEYYINDFRPIRIYKEEPKGEIEDRDKHPALDFYDNLEFLFKFTIQYKIKEFKGDEGKLLFFLKENLIGNFVEFKEYWSILTKGGPKIKHKIIKNVKKSKTISAKEDNIDFVCDDGEYTVDRYALIKVYKIKPKKEITKSPSSGKVVIYDKFRELRNTQATLEFLQDILIGKLIRFRDKKDREIKTNVLEGILLIPGSGSATKNSYYILRCEKGHQYEVDMYYPIDYMDKPVKKEIAIWDKFLELGRSYENLLNYLKETLIGRVVKFKVYENGRAKTGDIIKQKVDDVKLSEKIPDVIFICDGIEYKVNMVFMVEYYDTPKESKRAQKIDTSLEDEDVINNIMLIGVPSGEVVRVNRKKEFNKLFDKGLIFFANNYKPTFYAFRDDDKGKILDEVKKSKEYSDYFGRNFKDMT